MAHVTNKRHQSKFSCEQNACITGAGHNALDGEVHEFNLGLEGMEKWDYLSAVPVELLMSAAFIQI
jgi:hypothetical protein